MSAEAPAGATEAPAAGEALLVGLQKGDGMTTDTVRLRPRVKRCSRR